MPSILKSKMAAKPKMTSNVLRDLVAILSITNMGIATILSFLGNSEVEIYAKLCFKMAAILKSKMAAKREMTCYFLCVFITIHGITNLGIATIKSSFCGSELEI